jgi:hypothetical protein
VTGGIACMDPGPPCCAWTYRHRSDRGDHHAPRLITIRLLDQARDGTIAQAEADERLEHQAQATLRAKPAESGRVVILARRVRALVARTS